MITRVQVKNYRSLGDVDVELGPLTVLVGRNGAGKSTFLDVLRFVRDAMHSSLDAAIASRGGIDSLCRWMPQGKSQAIETTFTLSGSNLEGNYSFTVGNNQDGNFNVEQEVYSASVSQATGTNGQSNQEAYQIKNGHWVTTPSGLSVLVKALNLDDADRMKVESSTLVLSALSTVSPVMSQFRQQVSNTNFYTMFPVMLRSPQRSTGEESLEDMGLNLAMTLQGIKRSDKDGDLSSSLAKVVDGIVDFRVKQTGSYLIIELKHNIGNDAAWFDLAQESDGTIRVLALLAALYQSASHTLIAIEEPELAVHPGALAVLSDVIREASQRTQIIITTQSPDLISRFDADELRVVERVDGQTRIGPVDERQREIINEQLFSAGDLLRIEGLHLNGAAEVAA